LTFDADYIRGQFDFEVEAGSTQPRNESFRRQSALQLVDAMAPFVSAGVVDPLSLARRVLQSFDIKDPESYLTQQMAPEGAPGEPGMPPGMPPGGPQGPAPRMEGAPQPPPPADGQGAPESPIPGIPAELVNQLAGSTGLDIS